MIVKILSDKKLVRDIPKLILDVKIQNKYLLLRRGGGWEIAKYFWSSAAAAELLGLHLLSCLVLTDVRWLIVDTASETMNGIVKKITDAI